MGAQRRWSGEQKIRKTETTYVYLQKTKLFLYSKLAANRTTKKRKKSADSTTLSDWLHYTEVEACTCVFFIDYCCWQPSGIKWLAFQDGAEDPRIHPASISAYPRSRHFIIDSARMLTTEIKRSAAAAPALSRATARRWRKWAACEQMLAGSGREILLGFKPSPLGVIVLLVFSFL